MTPDGDGTRGGESAPWGSFFVGGRRVRVQDDGGAVPPRPTLLVWGDHMGHHPFFERRARDCAATPCDHLDLPLSGVLGNSHMPMSDRNSDAVLALVLDWLGDVPSTHGLTIEGTRHT